MLKSKHFKTEQELIDFVNDNKIQHNRLLPIVKDVTNGDWILFYVEAI